MPVASELMVKVGYDGKDVDRGLDQTSNKVSAFAKGAGALGTAATAAFLGVGAAAVGLGVGFGKAVSAASGFQATLSQVGAVSGASGAELAGLSDLALKMGADTQFSASQAAQAMAELAKGGIAVADMAKVLPGVLDLAAAGGLGLAEAATIATDTLAIFGKQGVTMDRVANAFAGAANISSISVNDMAESMKYIGPVANAMGLSLEDTAAAIALLGANGLKGSAAGTGLRDVLTGLSAPTAKAKALMADLGINVFDASGKMKDFAGISDTLKAALAGMSDQQRLATLETLFGKEGMSAAIAIMGDGANSIQSYTDKLKAASSAHATGKAMMDNFAGSMEQLKGSVETAAISLGLAFLPLLRQLVDEATQATNAALPFIAVWGPKLAAGIQSGIGRAVAIVSSFGAAIRATFNALQTGDFSNLFGPLIVAIATAFGPETAGRVTLFVSSLVAGLNLARDAVLTAKQAFAGDWVSSDAIATPVRIVGEVFLVLGDAVRTVKGWIDQLPPPVLAAAAAFLALGPALAIVGAILPALIGALTGLGPLISFLGATVPLLGSVIAALGFPITALIVAVGLLAAAWATDFMGIQTATMPVIAAIGAMITGTLLPALSQVGPFLSTNVVPGWQLAWAGMQAATDSAMTTMQPAIERFTGFLSGQLAPALQGIAAVAGPAFEQMRAAAVGAFEAARPGLEAFVAGVQQLASVVAPIMAQVGAAILDSLGPAVAAMTDWAQTVIPQFSAAFESVMNVVGPIVGALAELIGSALGAIAGLISAHSDEITSVLTNAWNIISATIGAVFAVITGLISAGLQLIAGDWEGAWTTIQATTASVWASIQLVVSSAIAIVGTIVSAAAAEWQSLMAAAWAAIQSAAATAMNNLVSAVQSGLANAASAIVSGVAGFPAAVLAIGGAMFSAGASIIGQLSAGIASAIGQAVAKVQAGLDLIKNMLPHSEPKDANSPLRGLVESGRAIFTMLGEGISQGAPAAVKAAADAASSVAKAIQDTLGALAALSSFDFAKNSPSGATLGWFQHLTESLVATIVAAAAGFKADALKAAGEFADAAGKVSGSIKTALDAFQALSSYDFAKGSPTGSALGWFRSLVTALVQTIAEAAAGFDTVALKAASDFADAAGKVTGFVKSALDAFAGLSKYVPPAVANIYAFGKTLRSLINDFALVAEQVTQEAGDAAGKFATAIGPVVETVGKGVDAFTKLVTFLPPPVAAIYAFGKTLRAVVNDFALLAEQITVEMYTEAAKFATGAGTVVGMIGSGVEAFTKLGDYVAPAASAIYDFGKTLRAVINDFALIAEQVTQEAVDSAAKFATGAGAVVGIIGNAVKGFTDLLTFVAPSQAAIDNFVYAVYETVRKIAEMASQLSKDGVAQAGAFGVAAGSILGALKTGLDVFTGLAKLVVPSAKAIDDFAIAIAYTVARIGTIADQIGKDGIEKAAKFGQSVQTIFGSLKSSMDILTNLAKFKDEATKAFDSLLAGLQGAKDRAESMVSQAKDLVLMAEEYAANMKKAAALFASGQSLGGVSPEQAGRTLGEGVASGARAALDIHSPSEVMAAIGRDVVAGLVRGMSDAQQDAAKKAAEVASAVANAVAAGVAAFTALGSFVAPGAGNIAAFGQTVRLAVNDLAVLSEQVGAEMLASAAKFAEGATKALGIYGAGLSGFAGLRDYVRPAATAIYDFGKDVRLALNDLALLAEELTTETSDLAGKFGEGVAKAVSGLANAVTGFTALKDYVRVPSAALYAFGKDLRLLVQDFAAIVDLIGVDMVAKAGQLGEGVGKIVGGVGAAVAGLTALRDFQAPTNAAIDAFAATVGRLMAGIARATTGLTGAGLTLAGQFADAAGKVLGIIGSGVAGLTGLATFVAPAQSAMDAFATAVRDMMATLARLAGTVATEGASAAATFAEAVGKVFAGLNAGTSFFKSLDNILLPDQGGIDRILAPMLAVVRTLADASRTLDAATLAGAGNLADLLTRVMGAVQAGNQALAPVAGGGGGGGGGGGNTYVYEFNMQGAQISGFDQFEDQVVSAIEDARRRGRIT